MSLAMHFFAWRSGMKVHALVITGGGRYCYSDPPPHASDRFLLYSGGLLFQIAMFLLAVAYILIFGNSKSPAISCCLFVFTFFNAVIFIGNIVPYKGNDGSMILQAIRDIRHGS